MYLGGMNRTAMLRCGLTDVQLTANVNIAEKILCRIVKEVGFKKVLTMAEYINKTEVRSYKRLCATYRKCGCKFIE